MKIDAFVALFLCFAIAEGFTTSTQAWKPFFANEACVLHFSHARPDTSLYEKMSDARRKQLGIGDDEDEYDLGVALDKNTDPLISKIIAGSLILAVLALLAIGVIIPSMTDYGEGVCNPILTQGRC